MNLKLLIAFLVLPFCGKAQIESDSLGTTSAYPALDYVRTHKVELFVKPSPTNDTVKCIMLVTDTCNCYHGQKTTDMKEAFKWEGFAYYIHGYAYTSNNFYYEYLDENKKPLSKKIIVWMSKNTEL